MRFDRPSPRRAMQDRAIVPMINVVFLLLIFFLMTATLAPPDPLEITPPTATGLETDPTRLTLYVAADGSLAYLTLRDDAVWNALRDHRGPLPMRVDARFPASDLAALLPRISAIGIGDIQLRTVQP